jgi:signal transduction histidine kinase/ActR/RegA family two-component response regulator/HAMP domain-containing protein
VWKDLTDNVNQLAANLTNQVRAIAEVATAVTEGDLTRQVRVEASGEVAVLKDKLNEMIRNLRETTRQNIEQDWLKTNRERFTRMLQGQRDLAAVSSMILSELAPLVSAQHGVFYSMINPADGGEPVLQLQAGYGYEERRHLSSTFRLGEGLVGQCAMEKKRILLTEVPGDYVRINSGLGGSPPLNIIVLPVLFEGSVRAVVELASFSPFSLTHQAFLDQLPESIGLVLSTIEANTTTENLLKQSQSLAQELRSQKEELRESNEDLGRQARLLAEQNIEAEQKNQEVEQSKRLLEEKAGQLALSSKYKTEFIANMSHELRTPLNSLLVLAQQLEDNPDDNMTATQVNYASVIRSSGNDLLNLLNHILEQAKVESGTVVIDWTELSVGDLRTDLLREFGHVAEANGVAFTIDVTANVPEAIITDSRRLHQILNNLLGNAFKFTEQGQVRVVVTIADDGWNPQAVSLAGASSVLAIAVGDTGIGIAEEHQARIFEAFIQGDGTTARNYAGTGLGLSISRELAALLGGEITVASSPAEGSTFTLYLPLGKRPTMTLLSLPAFLPAADWPGSTVAAGDPVIERHVPKPDIGRSDPANDPIVGAKILVVDDDARNVFAMKAFLERVHADVTTAESGADAIAALELAHDIDIVLMDIMMPGMDGYAAIRGIRALDHCRSLPIIAVTGKAVAGEHKRCIEAGANDCVLKPVDTVELLAVMRPWLPTTRPSGSTPSAAGPSLTVVSNS